MKNIFLKVPKKSIALLMAFVMLLSFMLTGCSVEDLLQELATDYIRISVNHELLNESYKNEPLYTYQIDAVVSNDYITDLTDATVSLNLPEGVEIIDGKANVKEKISCEEENEYYYTWKVSIEPTVEDRNLDYSVSVSSQLITTISTFESIFVEGQNENDNRLDFSVDTWNFENYTVKPIPINGTKKAWVFGRDVFALEYAKAEQQISALIGEAESEGYKVIGTTTIREDINSKKDQAEMQKLMAAAQAKKIDAVFVFSSKHISEDYDVSGAFMDALNKCDVVVYDNEGYEYVKNGLVNILDLKQSLMDDTYKISSYSRFKVYEPKERDIISTRIKDRVFQRSLCDNYLYENVTRSFINDNAACQIGKGTFSAHT